jgi:DNA adenine methylase
MGEPSAILDAALERAIRHIDQPIVEDAEVVERVRLVCRSSNRAGTRLLISCLLAKIDRPEVDIRKPYTEIGDSDVYSGRTYDERYVAHFVNDNDLPCNPTTAFLTPALRNIDHTLTPDIDIVGTPRTMYRSTLQLLTDVHTGAVLPQDLLAEMTRQLLIYRDERKKRMQLLLQAVEARESAPLSSEAIVTLIQQHLTSPKSSRLPVLVVAAAYKAVEQHLGERVLPLLSHTSADKQTGALGDLEITLVDDDEVVTSYEMKAKRVTVLDIENAVQKVIASGKEIDNYIFITTDVIDEEVRELASSLYTKVGVEYAILDCISFLRHFLHLFHRIRMQFLNAYQQLLLGEPESGVRQELKEAFLALRQAAEISE